MNRTLEFRAWDKEKGIWIAEGFSIIGEFTVFDMLKGYSIKDFNNIETIPMFILGVTWCAMCYYIYSKIDYSRGGNDE